MRLADPPQIKHLRRLTDSRGLIHTATGDFPNRFGGYDTLDNADALRLCAAASDTVLGSEIFPLAKVYFDFLCRARRDDACVRHGCDARGNWHACGDHALVQSRLARALAAVIVSELPISMRLSAADWWRRLLPEADAARTPQSAANWLNALGRLHSADPGRDLARAEALARWLVEDCYYPIRTAGWEWFESKWTPGAACIAEGLWNAYALLGDSRYAAVAEAATRLLIENCFERQVVSLPGTQGGWGPGALKPVYDQLPLDACALVEALCAAEETGRSSEYGDYAERAARWFRGDNVRGMSMLDPASGGCRDALTADAEPASQGATAMVCWLLTEAACSARAGVFEEPTFYVEQFSG